MNSRPVSVTERTREIGLTKAFGACRQDFLAQFLLKSFLLTFFAGPLGMVAAIVVAHLVPAMPLYSDMYKTANHEAYIGLRASSGVMLASFVILAAVNVVSGFWRRCGPRVWTR